MWKSVLNIWCKLARDAAQRVEEFEMLLDEASKRDPNSMLHATFLSSDMGKVYMVLARALDRDM